MSSIADIAIEKYIQPTELSRVQEPEVPEDWDYQKSVEIVKAFIYKWKGMTAEIINELWIARKELSKPGRPWPEINGEISPVKTWDQYCVDIGVLRNTANKWLNRWFVIPPELPPPFVPPLVSPNESHRRVIYEAIKEAIRDHDADWLLSDECTWYFSESLQELPYENIKTWAEQGCPNTDEVLIKACDKRYKPINT